MVAGGLLTIALAALFNPNLQKRWLLPKLVPLAADAGVERLTIDFLHVTPWSVELRGVHAVFRGMDVRAGSAELGFNPFGLLTDTIVVHELNVPDATVDLTHFEPGPPATSPFGGVMHVLDVGYGLALYDIDVQADVQLDATRHVHAELRGDDVRPHVEGTLDYAVTYTGAGQRVETQGRLHIDQLSGGRFRALGTEAEARISADALPAPERIALTFEVTPAPGTGHLRALAREQARDGIEVPPSPEAVTASLTALDEAGSARAKLDFGGLYRGDDGSLRGRYQLTAGNALVTPYTGAQALPAFAVDAAGEVGVQTMRGAVDLTADAVTRLRDLGKVLGDNPALPEVLTLHSAMTLAAQGGRLALTRFDHALGDAPADGRAPTNPLVALDLQAPLVFDVADPAAVLATPRGLGTVTVAALPLPWINGLLPAQTLDGGTLDAAFEIVANDKGHLQLLPFEPVTVGETRVQAGDDVLVPALRVSLSPQLTLSETRVRLRVADLDITNGERRLAGGSLVVTQPLAAPAPASPPASTPAPAPAPAPEPAPESAPESAPASAPESAPASAPAPAAGDPAPVPVLAPLRITYDLDADIDALRELPPLAARSAEVPLPESLRLAAKGRVELRGAQATIATLEATLAQSARAPLVTLTARQPFVLPSGDESYTNPRGELAQLALRGIDLAWISAFAPTLDLRGTLASAELLLTAPRKGRYAVRATAPLRLSGVHARLDDEAQISGLDVIVTPSVDYSRRRVRFDLEQLNIASGAQVLVRGHLSGNVPLVEDAKEPLGGEGRLELDLTHLAAQPALRRVLGRALPEMVLASTVDVAAQRIGDTVHVDRLAIDLRAGRKASLALSAERGLDLRPVIGRDERLARHVVGELKLRIRDLSSAVIKRFMPLEGLAFSEINADARLSSDGSVLHLDTAAPLRLERVRISAGDAPLLAPFSVGTRAVVDIEGRQLSVDVADFALLFEGDSNPALSGRLAASIEPDRTVPLTRLDTEFTAQLPPWLAQPVAMPGHKLTAGVLGANIAVTPDGAIAAHVALDGLVADAPLPLSHIELPVTGRMAADGRGFSFTAPLTADGRSGVSNMAVEANYAPEPDKRGLLKVQLDSALFYLNDLLATVDAVAPRSAEPAAEAAATSEVATPVALDLTRDEKAAWDVLPYGAQLDYHIGKLFYTDYLAFDEVTGKLSVRKRRMAATDLSARFHDSPLHLDGSLEFRQDEPEPYRLDVDGTVTDFNLNQFFKELVPGERPRIKGLFSVKLEASGEMPNLGQLRNATLFDVRMTSREGVFRPLPPSSSLLAGTSDVLGVIGETLSYVPTSGFGAGTIARLVNYITRIKYDIVDIHVRRAESQDVVIERFLVRSDNISMTVAGGITHVAGKDIVDSPLDLRGHLDMSGRGAAILYSMDLLQQEKNDAGYWRGPEFKIWGTPANAESNFAEIVRQASDGTVKGGITRPLAGLIGNLRYRWFGDDPDPLPPELAAEVEALEAEAAADMQQ